MGTGVGGEIGACKFASGGTGVGRERLSAGRSHCMGVAGAGVGVLLMVIGGWDVVGPAGGLLSSSEGVGEVAGVLLEE